jgi:hypothetical protein
VTKVIGIDPALLNEKGWNAIRIEWSLALVGVMPSEYSGSPARFPSPSWYNRDISGGHSCVTGAFCVLDMATP